MDMYRRRSFRRRSSGRPAQTKKVQIAFPSSYVGGGANLDLGLATTVEIGSPLGIVDVPVGARITTMAISIGFTNATANAGSTYSWMLVKYRSGQTVSNCFAVTDASQWSNIGVSACRNQVIKSFTGVTGTEDAKALDYVIQVKIPKIYQRMRDGDNWVLTWNSSEAGTINIGTRYKFIQ